LAKIAEKIYSVETFLVLIWVGFSKALKMQSFRQAPALQDEPVPNTTAAEN
jgi:hypothetical protein